MTDDKRRPELRRRITTYRHTAEECDHHEDTSLAPDLHDAATELERALDALDAMEAELRLRELAINSSTYELAEKLRKVEAEREVERSERVAEMENGRELAEALRAMKADRDCLALKYGDGEMWERLTRERDVARQLAERFRDEAWPNREGTEIHNLARLPWEISDLVVTLSRHVRLVEGGSDE